MVYAKFGGQTECIMGNWKIENCKVQGNEPKSKNTEFKRFIQSAQGNFYVLARFCNSVRCAHA